MRQGIEIYKLRQKIKKEIRTPARDRKVVGILEQRLIADIATERQTAELGEVNQDENHEVLLASDPLTILFGGSDNVY